MPIDFTGYMYAHTMIKLHRNYSMFLKKIQEFYFKKLEFFDAKISQNFISHIHDFSIYYFFNLRLDIVH